MKVKPLRDFVQGPKPVVCILSLFSRGTKKYHLLEDGHLRRRAEHLDIGNLRRVAMK